MEEQLYTFVESLQDYDDKVFFQPENQLKHFHDKIQFPLLASEGENPYHIKRPVGLLIYGAPGCGKSFLARKFAHMLKRPFTIVNQYDILYMKNGEYKCKINALFSQAAEKSSTIIIEDVETIIPSRDSNKNLFTLLNVATVLSLIKSCPEKDIVIIATTSRPQDVDPQIGYSGYLNELFYTPFPDFNMRCKIMRSSLGKCPTETIDIERLANECTGFSIADIFDTIDKAAIKSALQSCLLTTDIISEAICKKSLRIDLSIQKRYDEIHQLLEKQRNVSKEIGFK